MENDLPKIFVGPRTLADFDRSIQKEWIITNGLGGYASSTVLGINTRKYHGLLVAAFNPPVDRRVLLAKLDEEVQIGDKTCSTGSNEFKNVIHPKGFQFLSSFQLDPFPTYQFSINWLQLQKTIFMPHGKNAVIISYEIFNPNEDKASIRILPLINSRHFHAVTDRNQLNWSFTQRPADQGVIIEPSTQTSTLVMVSTDGLYVAGKGEWIEKMLYRMEESRGESSIDDNFAPGQFILEVPSGEGKKFHIIATAGKSRKEAQDILSSITEGSKNPIALYDQELERKKNLLANFRSHTDIEMENWLKWLILAADSFLVDRESTKSKSIIAGYHWFEDWGRDTMISLPGLTLVQGRAEDAKQILRTFKFYCQNGILPNRFPDQAGEKPVYNTVDATLWYFNAVFQYLKYTDDLTFVHEELWDTLQSIIEHYIQGTLYGIRMGIDSLIEHGPQLTWMDAAVNGGFVTPREGKAVEVQALWYNTLRIMEILARDFNQEEAAEKYSSIAERVREAFVKEFWNPERDCLFDVIGPGEADPSLRPNQVMAVALDFSLLDEIKAKSVVEAVWRKLGGTYGLRTLSGDDSGYVGKYLGDRFHRDCAYHNGTVWAWLNGPFITAFLKVRKHEETWRTFAFRNFLQPLFREETFQAGLGTISEIFDGDSPHTSRGCTSQAWSVAELLRAYVEDVMLKRPPYEQKIFLHP